MKVTRRDVLTVAGGSVVGIALTPAPWKLVDDLAIWTQNWKWIPRPPKGPETTKVTACSLCPRGCAAEARCIAGLPVSMRAAAGSAPLCPPGLTAHHLSHHPARISAPVRITRTASSRTIAPASLDQIVAASVRAMREAQARGLEAAVLDMRPGRSVSWAWRRLLGGLPHASVVAAPGSEGTSLASLASAAGVDGELGLDLAAAKTILSFGTPLAEGWGENALETILRDDVDLIQVEPIRSQTASIARSWIPCRPGSEAHVALAIANVLVSEGLVDARALSEGETAAAWNALLATMTPVAVEAETSVPRDTIVRTARRLAAARPVLVLAGEQPGGGRHPADTETAVALLNILLGAFETGPLVRRAEIPIPADDAPLAPIDQIERLENGSIGLLFVDASAGDATFPWQLAERKLARGALVVALSPFLAGTAAHATFVVPMPPPLEGFAELPTPFDAPAATLALAPPILTARDGTIDPAAFIRSLAAGAAIELGGEWTNTADLAQMRVAAIHGAARGSIADRSGTATPVASFASADEVWTAITEGARWMDDRGESAGATRLPAPPSNLSAPASVLSPKLALLPIAARDVTHAGAVSPVATKLYRESLLRRSAGTLILNPMTARAFAVRDGGTAALETARGSARVIVATDESVMPGVAALVVGPEPEVLGDPPGATRIVDICSADANGVWRASSALLVEG